MFAKYDGSFLRTNAKSKTNISCSSHHHKKTRSQNKNWFERFKNVEKNLQKFFLEI